MGRSCRSHAWSLRIPREILFSESLTRLASAPYPRAASSRSAPTASHPLGTTSCSWCARTDSLRPSPRPIRRCRRRATPRCPWGRCRWRRPRTAGCRARAPGTALASPAAGDTARGGATHRPQSPWTDDAPACRPGDSGRSYGRARSGAAMTFHVRLVSPPDQTEGLVRLLAGRRRCLKPGGAPGNGPPARRRCRAVRRAVPVRELRIPAPGGLPGRPQRCGRHQTGRCNARGRDGSGLEILFRPARRRPRLGDRRGQDPLQRRYAPSFYTLLAIAALIRAVGILTNSQILIVGAIVVGPEYNAIMGVALGLDKRARGRYFAHRRPAVGFSAAIVITLLFGLLIRWSGHTPKLYLGRGATRLGSDRQSELVLARRRRARRNRRCRLADRGASGCAHRRFHLGDDIPAAADIALSLAYSSWGEARGSAFQLLLNVIVLIVVGALMLRLQRIIWRFREETARPRSAQRPG